MDPRVDVFCHILPSRYEKARWERAGKTHFAEHTPAHMQYLQGGKAPVPNYQTLIDLDTRFRLLDQLENYRQVLSIAGPAIEVIAPDDSEDVSKALNDELAELVQKYPRYFAGAVAALPMDKPDAAARELERSLRDLKLNGVQLYSDVLGKPLDLPEFRPIFQIMSEYDLPILLHPARTKKKPDYASEEFSKYLIWQVIGWPYETSAAMFRIVFSGILDEYPNLKIIAHHTGTMIPFFAGRIEAMYDMFRVLIEAELARPLKKPVIEYFRSFYGDTSLFTPSSIDCACDFLGADHILFGTDMPFDAKGGTVAVEGNTASIQDSSQSAANKSKIFYQNFETIFRARATI